MSARISSRLQNKNLLELTREIASRIDFTDRTNAKLLKTLKKEFDVAEINIINQNGIITLSTHNDFLNYDMRGGEQSAEFLVLLDGVTKEYVQSYQPLHPTRQFRANTQA